MSFNLDRDIEILLETYPALRLSKSENDWPIVEGSLPLIYGGKELESYNIKIVYHANFPAYDYPLIFETGGRIPEERHLHTGGSLCLSHPAEARIFCMRNRRQMCTAFFIQEVLVPYLANQALIEDGSQVDFINGGYEHGLKGRMQYYFDLFQTDDLPLLKLFFESAIAGIRPFELCPCDSKKKIKKCIHESAFETMRTLGSVFLSDELKALKL
jgi:hypothetical protein